MRPLTWALKEVDPVGLHRQLWEEWIFIIDFKEAMKTLADFGS
jgi:hypothetical protein